MKKILIGLLAGAGVLMGSLAQAEVIGFDDVNANGKLASISKYNPHAGLTWSSSWFLGASSVSGYDNAARSGTQFVTNGFGVNNLSVTSSEGFNFAGAWFATPNTNGSKASWINITAFDTDNVLIGSTGNVSVGAGFGWVGAGFSDVGRLLITRDKGWFVMDDFALADDPANAVPEPGSLALVGLALLGLAAGRRGKSK